VAFRKLCYNERGKIKKEREIYDKSRKIIVFLPAEGLIYQNIIYVGR
jgi:hypothetical protein